MLGLVILSGFTVISLAILDNRVYKSVKRTGCGFSTELEADVQAAERPHPR
jgi:hypothetical protein